MKARDSGKLWFGQRTLQNAQKIKSLSATGPPSAECLGLFRPRLTTSQQIQTQTVGSTRSDQVVGETRQSHRCASLWSDSACGGWGGGRWSVSLLTLARTFSKEAGLTREKHIKNTSWERPERWLVASKVCTKVWISMATIVPKS